MSLSDCLKCWEHMCVCGYEWRNRPRVERLKIAAAILGIAPEVLEQLVGERTPEIHPMKSGESTPKV